MPAITPDYNAVTGLNALGFGFTTTRVNPFTPTQYQSIPEYTVHKNQSFFIETGQLFVPVFQGDIDGLYITYCNPGFSYKRRITQGPGGIPKRKDFFILAGGSQTPTINETYNWFNQPGDQGDTQWERVVLKVAIAGTAQYDLPRYFNNTYKEMLVGANGKFSLEPFAFPYTGQVNPRPNANHNGIQYGSIIKFFSEDQFSLVAFDTVQDIRAQMNRVPEALPV